MTQERPILFSGSMIRAILEGQKTQTRRVVKPLRGKFLLHDDGQRIFDDKLRRWKLNPYGQPGDLLYVRETWRTTRLGGDRTMPTYGSPGSGVCIEWKAGGDFNACNYDEPDWCGMGSHDAWRPSIHMPKWATRLWLRVRDVRVERLQDISQDDAQAEGIEVSPIPLIKVPPEKIRSESETKRLGKLLQQIRADERRGILISSHVEGYKLEWLGSYIGEFEKLWGSINAKRGFGWDTNPFVWVVEFERTDGP